MQGSHWISGSQLKVIFSTWQYKDILIVPAGTWAEGVGGGGGRILLLTFRGWRLRTLVNILLFIGLPIPLPQTIIQSKMPVVLRLRNLALDNL